MGKSMVKINGTYVKSIENGRDGKVGGISTLLDFKQSLAIINVVSMFFLREKTEGTIEPSAN